MRISDWSSDVCSSDLCAWGSGTLPGCAARRPAGGSAATLPRRGDLSGGAGCGRHAGAFLPGLVPAFLRGDRKSVVLGKSVFIRVDFGGGRIIQTKTKLKLYNEHKNI